MVNRIRASHLHWLNKGYSSKFRVGSWVWQETREGGWRTYQSKSCEYNNKDEDNSPKTLNDKKSKYQSKYYKQYSYLLTTLAFKFWHHRCSWKNKQKHPHRCAKESNTNTLCCSKGYTPPQYCSKSNWWWNECFFFFFF